MKQKYFTPEFYANEADRVRAYKSAIRKHNPVAILVLKSDTNCRYCCETPIGNIFFQVKTTEAVKFDMISFQPAQSLLENIML